MTVIVNFHTSMLNVFKKLFDFNQKEIVRLQRKVDQINALEDKARTLSDSDFALQTQQLKTTFAAQPDKIDQSLPWAFALVREAARRVLGLRHFDEQLLAAIALHEGKISEQKTGEGKTLTATAALYLNALSGQGSHLVTVNDYLVRRDAGWMGAIYHFLGLRTSAIISDASFAYDPDYQDTETADPRLAHLRPISRQEAYLADITYGINSEFGFDYLRDNMAQAPEQRVQRGFHFAIVDEADSVLIDEARTPHIISSPFEQDTAKYYECAKIVKQLAAEGDYVMDEKLRTAHLTDQGIEKIEKMLGVTNIYEQNYDMLFHLEAALKAHTLFKNNKEYIVRNGEVVIVDEFTGRLLEGRRFSEGLHQAIEAKENVAIKEESKTLATVSLQNYFRMYEKLAGMTGTAATEAEEFNKIYKTDVLVIPTHRPNVRKDHPDMIYKTEKGKFNAVVEDIAAQYKAGRPVLVGTTSIDKNEYLSRLLHKRGVPHELLNAKNHEREAHIIARAGEKGAVTVATNMAGRGVDIILGGEQPSPDEHQEMAKWQQRHDEVVAAGGLHVIGTERHESRRIDNQLRGRSGRQGDPGDTVFYVSLEDDMMRIFGGDQITKLMNFFNFPEDQPLSHPMVSKAMEQAQIKVEGHNFDIRKHLVEFDDVLNKQREIIYTLRRKMLLLLEENPQEFESELKKVVQEYITTASLNYFTLKDAYNAGEQAKLIDEICQTLPVEAVQVKTLLEQNNQLAFQTYIEDATINYLQTKQSLIGSELWFQVVRSIFLSIIDQFWTLHLTAIEDLREGINLRGFAQMDPLVEYKNEAFRLFEELIQNVYFEAVRRMLLVQIDKNSTNSAEEVIEKSDLVPDHQPQKMLYQSATNVNPFNQTEALNAQPKLEQSEATKLGRNDKCWCGSGKKYKKCHYPN